MPERVYTIGELLLPREIDQLATCHTCGPQARQANLQIHLAREERTGYIRCTGCSFAAPSSSSLVQDIIAAWNGANKGGKNARNS